MPLLVDTHILLWARITPERLTAAEHAALDGAVRRFVSAVSVWEIAILMGLGRLPDDPRLLDVPKNFDLLPVMPAHCAALACLPPIHKDPFDRMLIAQARVEGLALMTRDARMAGYGRKGATTLMLDG